MTFLQISSLPLTPIRPPHTRGQDLAERERKDFSAENDRATSGSTEGNILDDIPSISDSQVVRPIESRNRIIETLARNQSDDRSIPLASQKALQAFTQNAPNGPQQLGIELAGIDTFV